MTRTFAQVVGIASLLSAAACASVPAPAERMVNAEAAVRAAREVGSDRVPQASLHVKLAQEQIEQARALMRDGDNKRAELVLMRAGADAELGVALAREDAARLEAQRTLDKARAVSPAIPAAPPPTSQRDTN